MRDQHERAWATRAGAPRAARWRRRRGGWSARRGAAGRAAASSTLASSSRPRSPPDSVSTERSRSAVGEAEVVRQRLDARLERVAALALVALLQLAVARELVGRAVAPGCASSATSSSCSRAASRTARAARRAACPRPRTPATGAGRRRSRARARARRRCRAAGRPRGGAARRLAGAVRSDQRQAIARADQQRGAGEDVGAGIAEAGVGELGEGHACGSGLRSKFRGAKAIGAAGQVVIELGPASQSQGHR